MVFSSSLHTVPLHAAHQPASVNSPPVQQGGAAAAALAQRLGVAPLAPMAAAGARPYAGSALEKFQEAAHKVRSAASTSASALKAAGDSVSRAPDAIYRHLPTSAQQLVNAAQVWAGVGTQQWANGQRWARRACLLSFCWRARHLMQPGCLPVHLARLDELPALCAFAHPQSPGAVNRVLSLQLTAFWQNHSNAVVGVGAAAACYGLWRGLVRTSQVRSPPACHRLLLRRLCLCPLAVWHEPGGRGAHWWPPYPPSLIPCRPCSAPPSCQQLFVDRSDVMAASGLLALAASAVAGGALYLRRRYTIDPAGVYRLAMYRLNTHPGLLEASTGGRGRGREGEREGSSRQGIAALQYTRRAHITLAPPLPTDHGRAAGGQQRAGQRADGRQSALPGAAPAPAEQAHPDDL